MEYRAPHIAGRDAPYRSAIRDHLKGHTQELRGPSDRDAGAWITVRDIEDAFEDKIGRLLLSKTAVSQLGERLWENYQAFAQRDLSEYKIAYLFVDGIAERYGRQARTGSRGLGFYDPELPGTAASDCGIEGRY